jgi:hypothetical protein
MVTSSEASSIVVGVVNSTGVTMEIWKIDSFREKKKEKEIFQTKPNLSLVFELSQETLSSPCHRVMQWGQSWGANHNEGRWRILRATTFFSSQGEILAP